MEQLDSTLVVIHDPSILVPVELLEANEEPDACEEVRDEAELYDEVKHLVDLIELLLLDTTVQHLNDELVEVLLVDAELEQFQVSQEDVLWIVD